MSILKRLPTILLAMFVMLAMLALDVDRGQYMPVPSGAYADDDDGGGRGRGRGGRRGYDRDDDDRPSLMRVWRKKRVRAPRVVRKPVEQARQFEPRMLIARGLSDEAVSRFVGQGYTLVERQTVSATSLIRLRIPPRKSIEAARRELRQAEPAALIDFNHYYRPQGLECAGSRCLMRQISGWPLQEPASSCRPDKPIGLIDTRINTSHPSLAGSRITVLRLFEQDEPPSGAQHGTAVAALLVGKGDVPGLVKDWEVLAVDAFRKGDIATGYDLARAIDMLAARGTPVINMSLSGPDNAILAASVADALSRDILLVAAAGNDGPRAKPAYPAAYDGVLAVTAVDRSRAVYRRAARGAHIDIAAPGVNVWTAASVKGQRPRSGTSFAAPFVTAAAAMILAENPGFSRREVEIVLTNEAADLGDQGRDDTFGWGLLNISKICGG